VAARIAVISDVHGSLAALEAVIADLNQIAPDQVVHGGDLAQAGPRPAEVVDMIRALGWPGVVGNTDELYWRPDRFAEQIAKAPKLLPLLRIAFEEFAPATSAMLGPDRIDWLRSLPAEWQHDGLTVLHARPGDLWRAPMPDADEREFLDAYGPLGSLVVYGHIHRPFVRRFPGLTVANSGSVGSPYDGDWRASYLVITDGRPEIRRVEYDLDREIADLHAVGYPRAGWLAEIQKRGTYVPPEGSG
jgi:predicted phosphodiesterase